MALTSASQKGKNGKKDGKEVEAEATDENQAQLPPKRTRNSKKDDNAEDEKTEDTEAKEAEEQEAKEGEEQEAEGVDADAQEQEDENADKIAGEDDEEEQVDVVSEVLDPRDEASTHYSMFI